MSKYKLVFLIAFFFVLALASLASPKKAFANHGACGDTSKWGIHGTSTYPSGLVVVTQDESGSKFGGINFAVNAQNGSSILHHNANNPDSWSGVSSVSARTGTGDLNQDVSETDGRFWCNYPNNDPNAYDSYTGHAVFGFGSANNYGNRYSLSCIVNGNLSGPFESFSLTSVSSPSGRTGYWTGNVGGWDTGFSMTNGATVWLTLTWHDNVPVPLPPPTPPAGGATPTPMPTPTPTPSPTTVNITGRHVDTAGNLFSPAGKDVTIFGPTFTSSTANPWSFNTIPPGTYTITAAQISGYTISAATCVNSTCSASSTFNSGNIVSGLVLSAGQTTDIWFKYVAAPASPTPIPTPTPSPPSGSSSTTDVTCKGFTANWSAVSGATQYRVKVVKDGNTSYVNAGTATSKVFDWLLPGTYSWSAEAYVNNVYQGFGTTQVVNITGCATPPPPVVPPGSCATFYDGANFTGAQRTLYADSDDLREVYDDIVPTRALNDTVSSIKITPGVTVIVYKDPFFAGSSTTKTSDWGDMTTFNDSISSVKISGCGAAPPRRNIYGRKVVMPDWTDFGTAAGEIPPGSTVFIFSGSTQILTDGPETGEFFKTNLNSGGYRVEGRGQAGWLLQACVGVSANASENVCTPVLPEGEGASMSVTHDAGSREISVWFYYRRVPAVSNVSCVSLFSGEAYTGTRVDIGADTAVLPGSIDNLTRSIALAPGISATAYNNNNYGAPSKSILTSLPYLAGYKYDGSVTDLEYTISSIKVFGCAVPTPTPTPTPPPTSPTNLAVSALPACINSTYTATFNWTGTAANWAIDIDNDNNWGNGWLATKTGINGTTTDGPAGFNNGLTFSPGTSYYWRIYYNVAGSWAYPTPASFNVPSCPPISGPSGLGATASCLNSVVEVRFTWAAATNHNGYWLDINGAAWNGPDGPSPWGVKTLNIPPAADGSFTWSATSTVDNTLNSDVDPALAGDQRVPAAGKTYWWRLRAFNTTNSVLGSHVYPASSPNFPGVPVVVPDCAPNLIVTAFDMPLTAPAGGTVTATVTVRNESDNGVSAGVPFEVAVNSDSATMDCNSVENGTTVINTGIGARTSINLTIVGVTMPTVGPFNKTAVVMVDSDCQIIETNELDNTRTDTYTLLVLDLKARFVKPFTDQTFEPGQEAVAKIRVSNIGTTASASTKLGLWFGNQSPADCPTTAKIAPNDGEGRVQMYDVPALGVAGAPNDSADINVIFDVGSNPGPFVAVGYVIPQCDQSDIFWPNNKTSGNGSVGADGIPGTGDDEVEDGDAPPGDFPYTVSVNAWFETKYGDVGSQYDSALSLGGTISLKVDPLRAQSSYLLAGDTLTLVKTDKWKLSGYRQPQLVSKLYSYFVERFQGEVKIHAPRGSASPPVQCKIAPDSLIDGTGSDPLNHMLYCLSGAYYDATSTPPTGDIVWFVNGDLRISSNLILNSSDSLTFIVKGKITVETGVDRVDAILISGTEFSSITDSSAILGKALTVNGGVFAPKVSLGRVRDTNDNATEPAEILIFDPKYLVKLPKILGTPTISWEEVAP